MASLARCPVLVGRDDDLDLLLAILDQPTGTGAVVISGDAGLGKTRLVEEAVARAERAGWATVQGSCFEPDRFVPLAPVLDLLENVAERDRAASSGTGSRAAHLVRAIEAIGSGGEVARRRVWRDVADLLAQAGGKPRTLVVLEDLHWADEASVDLMLHVAASLRARAALVLMTCRLAPERDPLRRLLGELERRRLGPEILLRPLDRAGVEAMVAATLGLGRPPRRPFVTRVTDLTQGNPFLVEEVLRALLVDHVPGEVEDALDGAGELPVPHSIRDMVMRRLADLRPAARGAAVHAAVLGRRFSPRLLGALLQVRTDQAVELAGELVAAHLVVEAGGDRFAFRHELLRRAVLGDIPARERRALHREAWRVLAGSSDPDPAELARHAFEAELWPEAREHGRRAGMRAIELYSAAVAVEHLGRALEASRRLGAPPDLDVLLAKARALEMAGSRDRSRRAYEDTLAGARRRGDRHTEWTALVELAVLISGADLERTGELLGDALDLATELDDELLIAHTLNRLGNWHANDNREVEALDHHRRALGIFRRHDDVAGEATSEDLLALTQMTAANLVAARDHYRRAIALQRQLGDRQALVTSLGILGLLGGANHFNSTFVPALPFPECVGALEEALALAREIDWPTGEAFVMANMGTVRRGHGDYVRSLDLLQASLRMAEDLGHGAWIQRTLSFLGEVHLDLGEGERAAEVVERSVELGDRFGLGLFAATSRAQLASVLVALGHNRRAETLIASVLEGPARHAAMPGRNAWLAAAELALSGGVADRALAIVARLAEEIGTPVGRVPRLALRAGQALLVLDRPREAADTLGEGAATAGHFGHRAIQWQLLALAGHALGRSGAPEEGRAKLERARRMVETLTGALPEEQRNRSRAAAASVVPGLGDAPGAEDDLLTKREVEVAALLAQGLSNAQIAEALIISRQTADTHVKRILTKLGFRSRAQVAAWVVRHDPGG